MCDVEQSHIAGTKVGWSHFGDERWFPGSLEDFSESPECDGEDDEGCIAGECSECEASGHQQFSADQYSTAREFAEQVCGGELQQHNQGTIQADHLTEFQFIESHAIEVERQCDEGLHEDDVGEQAAGHKQQEVVILPQVLQCCDC